MQGHCGKPFFLLSEMEKDARRHVIHHGTGAGAGAGAGADHVSISAYLLLQRSTYFKIP